MTRHHRHEHHSRHHKSGASHETSSKSGEKASESKYTYGCWVGTPTSYTGQTLQQDKSPHIAIKFTSGSGSQTYEAEVNVASTSKDTELVYWMDNNWTHPLTTTLKSLPEGFNAASTTDGTGLSLDFIRTSPALLSFPAGQVVQDDDSSDVANNILDKLEPIVKEAIAAKATMYVFGRSYGTGIDDIHMNQGNTGDYENAVGVDGALVFYYNNKFQAVFTAFATQEVPTDDTTGAPTSSAKALDTIATGGSSSTTTS